MRNYAKAATVLIIGLLLSRCKDDEFTPLTDVSIEIVSPWDHSFYYPGGSIAFRGVVSRRDTTIDVTHFVGKWSSDKDGTLYESAISKNGWSEFTQKNLSRNIHEITFEVRNEVGTVLTRKISIMNLVGLMASADNDYSVNVAWHPGKVEGFRSYKLYRSGNIQNVMDPQNLLAVFDNFADTVFVDSTAAIGATAAYQLIVERSQGDALTSNVSTVQAGYASSVDYPIARIVADPKRDLLYGIIAPGRFDENSTGYGMVILGKTNLNVVKRMFETVRFSDLDIDPASNFLYLGRKYEIFKFSLATQQIVDTIPVNNMTRQLRVGSNDRLYYHVEEGANYGYEFRIVDLTKNQELPATGAYGFMGEFDIDPSDNTIYHGNALSSNTISAYKTTNDKFTVLKQVRGTDVGRSMTYANGYVMWSYQLYDKQLNFIGDFTYGDVREAIVDDALPDGSLAFAGGRLFRLADRVIWRTVPGYYDHGQFMDSKRLLLVDIQNPEYRKYRTVLARYTFVR